VQHRENFPSTACASEVVTGSGAANAPASSYRLNSGETCASTRLCTTVIQHRPSNRAQDTNPAKCSSRSVVRSRPSPAPRTNYFRPAKRQCRSWPHHPIRSRRVGSYPANPAPPSHTNPVTSHCLDECRRDASAAFARQTPIQTASRGAHSTATHCKSRAPAPKTGLAAPVMERFIPGRQARAHHSLA